jgi:hypothetical protein
VNELPSNPNYPPGMQSGDEDRREADDEFWSQWWDDKCRFAEENERDERFRERQERIENYERTGTSKN